MDIAFFSIEILVFLFCISAVAGFLDTMAGGGGLISLPALIMAGIPPLAALGTNKLQGSMGTATATFLMFRKKKVRWQEVKLLMLAAFLGSTVGAIAVQFINTKVLSFVVPAILLFIAIYFLISPQPAETRSQPKLSKKSFQNYIVPVIGWYDGMFGPGTGSFLALAGVSLRGQGLIDSTAIAKTLNFSTNIASLVIFLMAGKVVWVIGLLMMVGQMIGAWAGSYYLFQINPQYLRFLVVFMCVGMLLRYVFSA